MVSPLLTGELFELELEVERTRPADSLWFVDYWSKHFEIIGRLVQSGLDENQLFRLVRAIFKAGMKCGYGDAKRGPDA